MRCINIITQSYRVYVIALNCKHGNTCYRIVMLAVSENIFTRIKHRIIYRIIFI